MVIIDRYIRNALLIGVFITLLVLLPLIGFLLLGDELDHVGIGRYTLIDAFVIIGLSMPNYAHKIFPIAALIGCLLGLGGLANNSELNAMRALGISISRILWSILKAGLIAALFAVILGEVITPWSEEKIRTLRSELLSDSDVSTTPYGFWVRDGSTFINIRDILPDKRLKDIYIYEFDIKKRLTHSTHAVSAIYSEPLKAWSLANVSRSTFNRINRFKIKVSHFPKLNWPTLIDSDTLSLLLIDPHKLPLWKLQSYIEFMETNGLDATNYLVIFWSKIATPIVILVMMALSVPLLFGNMRKVHTGQRIFFGIIIGISFYILDSISSQLAVVFGMPPLISAFLPSLICFSGLLFGLRYQSL
ncbi:hypothetical protein TI05_00170 [Achromatium sp. WMS3]|nr:hypothetical protein TI05_00170 [Achromatium sp. WMS3]